MTTAAAVRATVTIVGGGFAGAALALHLTRQPGRLPLDVALVEPRPAPGPGLAYSPAEPELLLNVRAKSMSVWADDPGHFASWLTRQPESSGTNAPAEFAPRGLYGRYLAEELAAVSAQPAANGVRVRHFRGEALAAPLQADGRRAIVLADGDELLSHAVVLALGNFPPPPPTGSDLRYLTHPSYHPDPWAPGALAGIGPDDKVLLIGAGLTAVDTLLALRARGHRAPVRVVARHGRWPAAHGPADAPAYPNFYPELAAERTVAGVLRGVRRHLAAAGAQGLDWRPVLDALRPDLGRIWAGWPLAEQARFLRHLAGPWAQARHRVAPSGAAALATLTADGQLVTIHGRAVAIEPAGDELRVELAAPGQPTQWLMARHVMCCTGPLLDYDRLDSPLVRQLRANGCLTPDPLGLGILTDADGALLDPTGQPSAGGLFTLGASRRPAYFESTAVPELRQQAATLAGVLARRFGQEAH